MIKWGQKRYSSTEQKSQPLLTFHCFVFTSLSVHASRQLLHAKSLALCVCVCLAVFVVTKVPLHGTKISRISISFFVYRMALDTPYFIKIAMGERESKE